MDARPGPLSHAPDGVASLAAGPVMLRHDDGPIRRYQVLGERCSGTNFLDALVAHNLDLERAAPFPWKHGFPAAPAVAPDTLVLVIFRDALDWVRSLFARPWHTTDALRALPFDRFLRAEWDTLVDRGAYFGLPEDDPRVGRPLRHDRHPITGRAFGNPLLVRNARTAAFLGLAGVGINLVFTRLEWLAARPDAFLDAVATRFTLRRRGRTAVPQHWFGWRWPERERQIRMPPPGLAPADRAFALGQLDLRQEERLGYTYPAAEITPCPSR